MGQTITEKIFSEHVGKKVFAGEIVRSKIDMVIGNDITTPISIKAFEDGGFEKLANPDGFAIVLDHFIPAKDIASANQAKISRDFAMKHNLKNFFDEKDMGIEHALLPEKGLVIPGDVIIGADSHTCTHGALGAFSTGMGSTDISFGMITGGNWFKVPESIKYLSMDDRFSLCNMAIEAGAKNGIVAYDEITKEFLDTVAKNNNGLRAEPKIHYSDEDANYCQVIEIDVEKLEPVIAYPFLPSNGHSVSQAVSDNIRVDQVFIGSCTNGRLSDFKVAAEILKGKKVASHVRLILTPATQKILRDATKLGYIDTLVDAGAVVSNPTCGACLGGYMGILGDGEVCISTTNRNFVGRMGSRSSKIYLANSAVAAASAISGYITDPRSL